MSMTSVESVIKESVTSIKDMLNADSVVGEPQTYNGCTVIPVSRLSCGLVSGGYDSRAKEIKFLPKSLENEPVAVLGGGVTAHPMGFIVISDGEVSFVKTDGDNVNKWLEIVHSSLKSILKKD